MTQLRGCPHCGWQNDAASRICGGCGQPLKVSGSPFDATQTVPLGRAGGASGTKPLWAHNDAPTQAASPAPRSSRPPAWPGVATAPTLSAASSRPRPQAVAPARAGRLGCGACLLRGLMSMATTVVLLVVLAGAAWAMVVRPYVHAKVDSSIQDGLTQVIASIPPIPEQALRAVGGQFSVSAADINTSFANNAPQDRGWENVAIAFDPGTVVLAYTAYNQPGTIQITLRVRQGALVAADTQVTGPLGLVESGDELQATLNRAFAQLAGKTPHGFQSVAITPGMLTVALKT